MSCLQQRQLPSQRTVVRQLADLRLGLLLRGDVSISAQHADNVPVGIDQRGFAGVKPGFRVVGMAARLLEIGFGLARCHHRPVVGVVACGGGGIERQVEVGFAAQVIEMGKVDILRKALIGA